MAQSYVPAFDSEAACGARDVDFQVKSDYQGQHLPVVDAGKAVVYFIETQKIDAIGNITVQLALDGAWVGANQGDSYFLSPWNPANITCARAGSPAGRAEATLTESTDCGNRKDLIIFEPELRETVGKITRLIW
jgi:hypothetical protein